MHSAEMKGGGRSIGKARLSMIGRAYEVDLDKYVSPQTEHRVCMVRSAVEEKVGYASRR